MYVKCFINYKIETLISNVNQWWRYQHTKNTKVFTLKVAFWNRDCKLFLPLTENHLLSYKNSINKNGQKNKQSSK